ncbi:hypothetical protein ERJ75_000266300 [Trypanosoma vivax]|nr:hypothetical protein ERJ75_000266300 [Trypanosoma vivax]
MVNQRMCSSVGTGAATAKSTRTQGQEGRAEQQRTCHAKPSIFPAWQINTDAKSQRSGLGEKRPRDGNDPTGAMLAGTAKRHGGGGEREKAEDGQKMEEWSERRSCVQRGEREEASGEATSPTQTTVKDAWLP